MRILARAGAIDGAQSLLEITQAHIDGCTYIGPGGLKFAQRLADLGGRVAVPTTLNSNSVDRRRWQALGVSPSLGEPAYALGDAYLEMGCSDQSFTCAPCVPRSSSLRQSHSCFCLSIVLLFWRHRQPIFKVPIVVSQLSARFGTWSRGPDRLGRIKCGCLRQLCPRRAHSKVRRLS